MPLALPEFHSAAQHQKYTFSIECTARPIRPGRTFVVKSAELILQPLVSC